MKEPDWDELSHDQIVRSTAMNAWRSTQYLARIERLVGFGLGLIGAIALKIFGYL